MQDKLNLPSESDIKKNLTLDDKKLPSFPQVAAKLLKISGDKTSSLPDISKIVETDPSISIRVLEIVNSAMYGLGKKVTSLSEAVVFLGVDEIKRLAIGMTVFEKMFKFGHAKQFDRLLFWRHCICVAVLSMEIAKETGYADPEEAYIAGLIHDIGKIFLDIKGKKDYNDFILELSLSTDLVIEKERSTIGIGHDDVGAFFCSLWELPEKLIIAVKYHHQPFEHKDLTKEEIQLISIVSLANFLCWTQGIGSFDFIRPPVLAPEVEKTIRLDKIDIIKCILQMNKEVENISKFYHFVFPSISQLRENLLWANLKLSKANTKYYYQKNPLTKSQDMAQTKNSGSMPSDMALELGKPLAKAKSIKEVLDIVMYQVGRIFQPQHWSILLKDPKTSDMVFSVVVGTNKKKLQGLKLPKGEGVAGHIMETGESLIIRDVAQDKRFSVRVDKYTGFKTNSIIGTPLKTDAKIFGVIELINRINEDPFTSLDLKILSSIAEYAAIAIERSYYNQALTNLATKDSLTGLKNRWSFEHAIGNEKEVLRRYGTIFSILIIKIKRFRRINETMGQSAEDKILKEMALILSKIKRQKDEIFRYGEDSFILLLPQTYADGTKTAKQKITDAFSLALCQKDTSPIQIDIFPHTLSAKDSGQLKNIVGNFLSKSKVLLNEDTIEDFEDSLHPILEQDHTEASPEIKNKQTFGKLVSLGGRFIRLKTGESGHIRVEKLSMLSIGFRISKSHRIQVNDFLDIQFTLDNINKAIIKRRIMVIKIKGNYIDADFYNPPPYAKNLGFYLMGG
ncbi:HDOD domain-containing protein [Desulfobacula phenolica]|uniref:Diguanylate cyclase (GGDEF) domain-containing protein/HDIG domain-containing protein n=1 Tax=Desulfobacula phenolica TaxID=90732 RepID=A0A1H2GIA9_9BACT|nr:HDOD domain-containing protein [Desulfobacula phenolica]SDU19330.1 diguanylate cyclase (GGDEF) domain-containing protein/HDIG domain-containing protein [Desulfobacula phenolica]